MVQITYNMLCIIWIKEAKKLIEVRQLLCIVRKYMKWPASKGVKDEKVKKISKCR